MRAWFQADPPHFPPARLIIAPPTDEADERRAEPRPVSGERLSAFFEEEGAAVLVSPGMENVGPTDKGIVAVSGSSRTPVGSTPPMSAVVVSSDGDV